MDPLCDLLNGSRSSSHGVPSKNANSTSNGSLSILVLSKAALNLDD
jgi:hypothetical protein